MSLKIKSEKRIVKEILKVEVNANEQIFVLRAQDYSAPSVIIHWIALNFENCSDEKLRDAFEHALLMKQYANRKAPD